MATFDLTDNSFHGHIPYQQGEGQLSSEQGIPYNPL